MRRLDGITDSVDMHLSTLGAGDRQGSLACCSPWGCKQSDMTDDWTDLHSSHHSTQFNHHSVFLERICNKKEINETYMYWHYISKPHRIGFEWYNYIVFIFLWDFPGADGGEEPTCQYRRCRDAGSIPGSGGTPGGRHDKPLQYSCLENLMDEEPGGLQTVGSQRVGRTEATAQAHTQFSCILVTKLRMSGYSSVLNC